jgi:hypothetical protein
MDLFTQLFGGLLAFVYHCFDRIVIYGYLSGLSRPERVVNFFHQVVGVPVVSREILSQRSGDYSYCVTHSARRTSDASVHSKDIAAVRAPKFARGGYARLRLSSACGVANAAGDPLGR